MRVLHGVANLDEQFQTRDSRERVLVAVFSDFYAPDQFHHEVRPAALRRSRIEDVSDIRMVHQRQGLPLGLKAGNDAFRVHARLDHLECNTPVDRLLLFGHVNSPATAFADLLQ